PLMPAFTASTGDSLLRLSQTSSRQSQPMGPPSTSLPQEQDSNFHRGVQDLLSRAREALAAAKSSQAAQAGSFQTPTALKRSPLRGLGGSPSIGWQPPSPEPAVDVQRPSPQPHPSPSPSAAQPSTASRAPVQATGHRLQMWCTPEASTVTDITLASPELQRCSESVGTSPAQGQWQLPMRIEPICGIVTPLQPDKE
ncbi:unnamed protein product, partial [Symbiodinium sp. CCMP2456]